MKESYKIPSKFLRKVTVKVIGAGGTGSAMIAGLAQMCVALQSLDGAEMDVVVYDDDIVTSSNVGRQAFANCDVGLPKSRVLVNRVNQTFGLRWKAIAEKFTSEDDESHSNCIYIGCVDTRKARKEILLAFKQRNYSTRWWLDCGNGARSGQVVLGAIDRKKSDLPSVADLFPEVVDTTLDGKDDQPSCSLPQALQKQDLFTNRMVADTALNLLWQLFRYGETDYHGVFINLQTMRTNPLAIDPVAWERMGYTRNINDGN